MFHFLNEKNNKYRFVLNIRLKTIVAYTSRITIRPYLYGNYTHMVDIINIEYHIFDRKIYGGKITSHPLFKGYIKCVPSMEEVFIRIEFDCPSYFLTFFIDSYTLEDGHPSIIEINTIPCNNFSDIYIKIICMRNYVVNI